VLHEADRPVYAQLYGNLGVVCVMRSVQPRGSGWVRSNDSSCGKIAGWEGWLAPAQGEVDLTLNELQVERGQATLPNLQFCCG